MGRNPYHESRRGLKNITSGFVGWKMMCYIADECLNNKYYYKKSRMFSDEQREAMRKALQLRDRDLAAALSLTGGRITEVLMARKENFVLEDDFIYVKNLPLLKRHTREKDLIETKTSPPTKEEQVEAKKNKEIWEWITKENLFEKYKVSSDPTIIYRQEFPIPRWEPMTDFLVERINKSRTWLFPSPYTGTRKESAGVEKWMKEIFGVTGRPWISPQRAYQIVQEASQRIGEFVVIKKVKAFGVWNHWFRSQRASQLARDYEFGDSHLNAFFGWVEPRTAGTARRYTKIGVTGLEDQMVEKKERFERSMKRDFEREINKQKRK